MAQVKDNTRLFRGQGQVFLAERVSGKPAGFTFVGNVSELMLSPETEKIEHSESQTGNNSIDKVIERALKVGMSMTTDSMFAENLRRFMFGTVTENVGATITAEAHKAYLGKYLMLGNINVQTFNSLTDVGGGTVYTAGTDYEVIDLSQGMILILNTGAIPDGGDVEANYDTGNSETISAFTSVNKEYWLRFVGLNTAENNNPVAVDLFKVRFAPADELSLINDDDFSEFKQEGDCLFDACQPVNGAMGRYYAIRQLTPADAGAEC